jgi:hypothetical protein
LSCGTTALRSSLRIRSVDSLNRCTFLVEKQRAPEPSFNAEPGVFSSACYEPTRHASEKRRHQRCGQRRRPKKSPKTAHNPHYAAQILGKIRRADRASRCNRACAGPSPACSDSDSDSGSRAAASSGRAGATANGRGTSGGAAVSRRGT